MNLTKQNLEQAIKKLQYFKKCKETKTNISLGDFSTLEIISITGHNPMFPSVSRINENEAIKRLEYLLAHPKDYENLSTHQFTKGYWNDVVDITGLVWAD